MPEPATTPPPDAVAGGGAPPLSQLALMHDQLRRSPYVMAAMDLFLAWVFWRNGASAWIAAWVVLSSVVQAGRALHVARIIRGGRPTVADGRAIEAWFLASGLARVVPVVVAFGGGMTAAQHIVTMLLVGQAAGGVGSAAGAVRAYLAWVVPTAGSLAIGWWTLGGFENSTIGVLVVLLAALLSLNVRAYGQTLMQLRQEVERANAERDRAEAERARANEEWQRAETAVLAKTRFFAAASHDLRQPLAVLRWYGDAVRLHARQLDHAPLLAVGEGIDRALQHAEPLVHKYLDIARIEAGALELVPTVIDVPDLLERIRAQFAVEADERGLALAVDCAASPARLQVETDDGVLCNILDNLVGNALKFTPQGRIELRAERVAGPSEPRVRISVEDTGVGIAAQHQERVFEDFFQVGNPERSRSKGLGLGLAIVRRQALLLGASLRLVSAPNQGACFQIELPAATGSPPLEPAAATAEPGWPSPTARSLDVLVIDDEPEVRQALTSILSAVGWRPRAVGGALEAHALCREGWRPDAIVVDHRLQGEQTGAQLVEALRAAGCGAPAVIVTGDVEAARLQLLARSGLPVLHKPVQAERLIAALLAAVEAEAAS